MNPVLALTLQSMQSDMAKVDRVAVNLANAQTVGFKREVAAAVSFDRHIAAAAQAQPGQQSQTASMVAEVDQTPGTLRKTGESLDVAISGPGWFEVQTEHGPAYTRQGNLQLDPQGRVVTAQGNPVMGVDGEITLPHRMPRIDAEGRIFEGALPGGAAARPDDQAIAQLKIVSFDPNARVYSIGNGLFKIDGEAGAPRDSEIAVHQGFLENSNVTSMQEMLDLMQTLRHFESMQKVAQGYDDLVGTAIRKLGDS